MKTKLIISIAFFFVGFALLIGCKNPKQENTENEKFYYTCSMHSQVHEDAPGKCPICGMDLVKKEIK